MKNLKLKKWNHFAMFIKCRAAARKFYILLFSFLILFPNIVFAEVSIETSVDRSTVSLGDQIQLDVIVSNAEGRISQPVISSVDGFASYSQGHSQEISFINGQSSSRNIFSYTFIATSAGKKKIGPFRLTIGGREYEVSAVGVEVMPEPASSGLPSPFSNASVSAPSPRSIPQGDMASDDIFIRAWLDKDEAYVNEPVVLTYTIFTRLSAAPTGFEKKPVATGFWTEEFPPEKSRKRTEQMLRGVRYLVADVHKIALFPTQAGVFTIDPGVYSAAVEMRSQDPFSTFYSGGAPRGFSSILPQVVQRSLPAEPLTVTVKALPERGRPASFSGAVGHYDIDSSLDKNSVEAGSPATYKLTIHGEGNIETLQLPTLPKLGDFKIYDSSSSSQLSKARFVVEGSKTSETVIVPRKAGDYTLAPLQFSYFDPKTESYVELETPAEKLRVTPGTEPVEDISASTGIGSTASTEQHDVSVLSRDVRYIRLTNDSKPVPPQRLYRQGWFWPVLIVSFLAWILAGVASRMRRLALYDEKGERVRRSHGAARKKLKAAEKFLKESKADLFYAEVSRALTGYFADRLGVAPQTLSVETIEAHAGDALPPQVLNDFRKLTEELALGRYGRAEKNRQDLESVYDLAERVLTGAEKVKFK